MLLDVDAPECPRHILPVFISSYDPSIHQLSGPHFTHLMVHISLKVYE